MSEHPPRPILSKEPNGTSQENAPDATHWDPDSLDEAWFRGALPLIETPSHTPATEARQLPRNVLDSLMQFVRENPRGSFLLTGAAMAIAACSVDYNQYSQQKHATEQQEPTATTQSAEIEIGYDIDQIDLTVNGEVTLHVRDGLNPEAAAEPLSPIAQTNSLFEWHTDIVMAQYKTSFGAPDPIYAFQNPTELPKHGTPFVTEDSFVDYGTVYGNMEIEDSGFVSHYVESMWLLGAQTLFGDSFDSLEDLENLTAQQWMTILQVPGLSLLYDESLASIYSDFDAKKTELHRAKSIDDLLLGGVGVCRDTERLNITSFMLANERFHLIERGLLYVPQINVADAKHTRGAFLWSQTPEDIVVIGVDTTFANGSMENTFDVSQADTVAWYTQQFDDSIITDSQTHIELYELALQMMPEMSPTAVAMLERSILSEKIALYEKAESVAEKRSALNDAFETLLSQIVKEETVEVFPLNVPSRKVRMYDLFLRIATELDMLKGSGAAAIHTAVAKRSMASYLHQEGIDPEKARSQVEEIDRLPSDERDEYLAKLATILQ